MINAGKNYLLHKEVKSAFKACPAKYKLYMVDACHSGSIRDKEKQKEDSNPNNKTIIVHFKVQSEALLLWFHQKHKKLPLSLED